MEGAECEGTDEPMVWDDQWQRMYERAMQAAADRVTENQETQ
jgi:hypothetical protein